MSDHNTPEEVSADEEVTITFKDIGLGPKIIQALDDLGYEKPTPIQARAIPAALEQRDVLGIAQTGTGKTGAFTLPTMHKLARGRARARMPRCLIICPTRELAAQVAEDVENYGKYLRLEMALLIGGVSFAEQDRKLTKGVDILIATPGRLLDQFDRGKILMTGVQTLIVDEADRMLDMGFIPDIERIFEMTPFTRQTLFFSATMPNEIKRLVDKFLHRPVSIQIARKNMTAKTVTQRIVRTPSSDPKQKRTALRWLIDSETVDNGIIFCNRKRDVDIVAKSLNVHGHDAAPIHGDLAQSLRTETLNRFRNGEVKFLVASDVAARGLDVPTVSHVFNYDVPNHSEDYVHRIGRTGRAGRKGDAITLVAPLDGKNYDDILRLIKLDEIPEIEIPGIEDFPKDAGGRNKRGRDGGRGRGRSGSSSRSRDGRRDATRRNDGSYHDGISSTEKVSSRKAAPKKSASKKASAKKAEVEKPAAEVAETPKAKAPAKTTSGERRRAAPGRRPAHGKTKAKAEAPVDTPAPAKEESRAKRSSSRTRRAPSRAKPKPEDAAKAKKAEPKPAPKPEPKAEPKAKDTRKPRSETSEKPRREKSANSGKSSRSNNRQGSGGKSNRSRNQKSEVTKPEDGKSVFGDDVPAFLKF